MKYYGNGPWLYLMVHGSKVTFRRPKGSDVNAVLDAVPAIRAAMVAADAMKRAGARGAVGPSEMSLSVPVSELRAVCTFLADHTLAVDGMGWGELDAPARADVWDEQGTLETMRVWGTIIACHATPAAAEGLNAMLADIEFARAKEAVQDQEMRERIEGDHASADGSSTPPVKGSRSRKRRAVKVP